MALLIKFVQNSGWSFQSAAPQIVFRPTKQLIQHASQEASVSSYHICTS